MQGFVSLLGTLDFILGVRSRGGIQSREWWDPVCIPKDSSVCRVSWRTGGNRLTDVCGHPGTGGAPGLKGPCPGQPHTQSGRCISVLSALEADSGRGGPPDQPNRGDTL